MWVPCECPPKGKISRQDFNCQVDNITYSVDTTQPSSPVTPVIVQWPNEQSGHSGMDRGNTWAQQHGLLLRSTLLHPFWAPNLLAMGTNTESPEWHHPLGWSASYVVAGCLHWTASIMKGVAFCSCWNRLLLCIWICLPYMPYFCKNYYIRIHRMSYPPSW